MRRRVGLLGFGVIGSYVFRRVLEEGLMDVAFIYEPDRTKTERVCPSLLLRSMDKLEEMEIDLVIEAAHPCAVKEFASSILPYCDLLLCSLTSLADESFRTELERTAQDHRRRIFIPHGAILGLDGIRDGARNIDRVVITTTKPPRNLGLEDRTILEAQVVFEGSTRKACELFPRNVNSHAAIALAGIGFDKTFSRIIADPNTDRLSHVIEVNGQGLSWRIQVESFSLGSVTGSYTPESLYQTVKKICTERPALLSL